MTPKEQAAMQQALEDIGNTVNQALATIQAALAEQAEQKPVGYFAYDEEHDIWEELTGPNAPGATPLYTAPQPVEQEPVAKIALKNCIYFDSIDFNQTPPYLRYDTGDSTPKENWIIYCDIQEELRKNGYELTDSDVDHDTVCGDVTPMAAAIRNRGAK